VLLLAAVVAGGVAVGAYFGLRGSGSGGGGGGDGSVHLTASNAYDPEGDGREHDEEVANATDGNLRTYWETEHYSSDTFGNLKDGVGIVVDAGGPVRLGAITVASDTPGYVAKIEAGASSSGPFDSVSSSQTVGDSTTFQLSTSTAERYYLVWITQLAPGQGRAHVNEVAAGTSAQ
jgi:hypothetical protein